MKIMLTIYQQLTLISVKHYDITGSAGNDSPNNIETPQFEI